MMHRSPSFSSTLAPAAVTMDCTPWGMEGYAVHPFDAGGGLQRRRRRRRPRRDTRSGPMILAPANLLQGPHAQLQRQPQRQHLEISDPTVAKDTDDLYALTFDLPADVDHDGLEVVVTGRLLTVKARITREEDSGPSASRGGWVMRSSRTDSVSRSFVLPEGISTSTATASLSANSRAEVSFFSKGKAAGDEGTPDSSSPTATAAPSTTDSAAPVEKATTDAYTSSADYLASLFRVKPLEATDAADAAAADGESTTTDGDAPAAAVGAPTADAAAAERPRTRPESPFEALDQEFRELAKAMWGEEVVENLRAPTQEELAEKAAAAKEAWAKREAETAERVQARMEARAKRLAAMRRATMAADVSLAGDGTAYLVKVALPEGSTRDKVKLTANPDKSLRVTVSDGSTTAAVDGGGRSLYKDVRLPKDALLSEISAKFETEQEHNEGQSANSRIKEEGRDGVEGAATTAAADEVDATKTRIGGASVSGLEVAVGRAVPPQSKRIDIM
ncbi:unnamed protein product [Pylaiella littoralis]